MGDARLVGWLRRADVLTRLVGLGGNQCNFRTRPAGEIENLPRHPAMGEQQKPQYLYNQAAIDQADQVKLPIKPLRF
jgi:hypothetical protein